MISLTRLDGQEIYINADEIETMDIAHEVIIALKSGRKIHVRESSNEIVQRVIDFRRQCAVPWKQKQ
jgi:flagellar protein FlbD